MTPTDQWDIFRPNLFSQRHTFNAREYSMDYENVEKFEKNESFDKFRFTFFHFEKKHLI